MLEKSQLSGLWLKIVACGRKKTCKLVENKDDTNATKAVRFLSKYVNCCTQTQQGCAGSEYHSGSALSVFLQVMEASSDLKCAW